MPTGLGRVFAIVAILGLAGYLFTGSSSLGVIGLAALLATGLHWAVSGGWGEGSYANRAGRLPKAEAPLGGQRGSAGQWVWYLVGVLAFLAIGFAMAAIAYGGF
jgi:hypothetical protein